MKRNNGMNRTDPQYRLSRAAALLSVFLCLAASPAVSADWPMFRGNAARTGYTSEQAAPPLSRAWEFSAGGDILSSPVVYGGAVFFGSRDGKIRAVSASAGAGLWSYQTGGWVDSSPAVYGAAVYAASVDGYLYALNRTSGALLWRAPLGGPSVSSPLPLAGKIFVGAGQPENKLKVFDAATGELLAERPAGQPVESAPSTDGTVVYYGANDGRLYAVYAAAAGLKWSYQTMGGRYSMTAAPVSSGTVYALPGYDENKPLALGPSGALLNADNGAFDLTGHADSDDAWVQTGSPAVADGRLYFSGGSAAVSLYALETVPADNALAYVWASTPSLGGVSSTGLLSSPVVANGTIYVGDADGYLALFSTAGVALAAGTNMAFPGAVYASPAVANGRVFAAGGNKLIAYQAAYAAAISSPAYGEVVNGTVPVRICAAAPAISGYTLEYGAGTDPLAWTAIVSSSVSSGLDGAEAAVWDTSALSNGDYVLRLTVAPGAGNTARLRLRVNAPPAAPSGLTAADVPGDGGNKIALAWAASAGAAAYRVYRDAGSGYALLASVSSAALVYTDAYALTGATYSYTIRSYDGYVESTDSNIAAAFSVNNTGDAIAPAAITDLAAVPGTPGAVALSWTAPGNDGSVGTAAFYLVRCSTDPAYNWSDFDGASLKASSAAVEGPAGDNQGLEFGGLMGGVTYYFAVKTADFVPNRSGLSNIASAYAAPDVTAPGAPSALYAADTPGDDGGSITLSWTLSPDDGAGAGDVYGYHVYRGLTAGGYSSTAPYASVGVGISSYTDVSASENVRFYYSVAAFDSTNVSYLAAEASGVSASNWRFFDAAQGGSVRLSDGARLDIPSGSASQNDSIMMVRVNPSTYQPEFTAKADTGVRATGVVYEVKFKTAGTTLARNATLSLPYTDAEVADMAVENLRMYSLSGGTWNLLNSSRVDATARRVTAEVGHFSLFRIMEYLPSGALLAANEVYTYPNPARGASLTFKFRPAYKSDVSVDVYNVAGEKVARLNKDNCPAGVTSEIVWELGKTASGVYVYRLEARSAAGSKTVEKKLAVIR